MGLIEFSEWLQEMINAKGLNQKTLADKAGIDSSIISRAVNRERLPSNGSLKEIAAALEIPQIIVFRAAGILDEDPPDPRALYHEIVDYRLRLLTDAQLSEVMIFIDFIQTRDNTERPLRLR